MPRTFATEEYTSKIKKKNLTFVAKILDRCKKWFTSVEIICNMVKNYCHGFSRQILDRFSNVVKIIDTQIVVSRIFATGS